VGTDKYHDAVVTNSAGNAVGNSFYKIDPCLDFVEKQ